MVNIILTTSVSHFRDYFSKQEKCSVVSLGANKDGKYIFPDGEIFMRLPELSKEGRFVVLHSGAPSPNDGIAELELILSILRRNDITNIEVFFTYMPYSMQDKIGDSGATNAAEDLILKLTGYYGVKKVYAIDPHFHDAEWLVGLPFVSVSPHEMLVSAIKADYPGAVFVAPDAGHEKRAQIEGFKKTRVDSYTVTHEGSSMEHLAGKTVAVVDDIIETGGTMIGFHTECMKYKPKELIAVVTHGVLPEGIERLKKDYTKIFLSNTINRPESNVDIAPLILEGLKV